MTYRVLQTEQSWQIQCYRERINRIGWKESSGKKYYTAPCVSFYRKLNENCNKPFKYYFKIKPRSHFTECCDVPPSRSEYLTPGYQLNESWYTAIGCNKIQAWEDNINVQSRRLQCVCITYSQFNIPWGHTQSSFEDYILRWHAQMAGESHSGNTLGLKRQLSFYIEMHNVSNVTWPAKVMKVFMNCNVMTCFKVAISKASLKFLKVYFFSRNHERNRPNINLTYWLHLSKHLTDVSFK